MRTIRTRLFTDDWKYNSVLEWTADFQHKVWLSAFSRTSCNAYCTSRLAPRAHMCQNSDKGSQDLLKRYPYASVPVNRRPRSWDMHHGTSLVVQWVKLLSAMLVPLMEEPIWVLTAPFLIQLPDCTLGKSKGKGSNSFSPLDPCGRPSQSFWHSVSPWPSPLFCNHLMSESTKERSLSLQLFCHSAFQTN